MRAGALRRETMLSRHFKVNGLFGVFSTALLLGAAGCPRTVSDPSSSENDRTVPIPSFAREVEDVLQKKMTLVEQLAADPMVVEAVRTSNRQQQAITKAEILQLDEKWQRTEGINDFVKSLMTNECAKILAEFEFAHEGFPEVFVTNERGLIVAETNKTTDYYQADELWWVDAYNDGAGKSHYGEIEFDKSAGSECISLHVPVIAPETGRAISVIKAVCDITAVKMEL